MYRVVNEALEARKLDCLKVCRTPIEDVRMKFILYFLSLIFISFSCAEEQVITLTDGRKLTGQLSGDSRSISVPGGKNRFEFKIPDGIFVSKIEVLPLALNNAQPQLNESEVKNGLNDMELNAQLYLQRFSANVERAGLIDNKFATMKIILGPNRTIARINLVFDSIGSGPTYYLRAQAYFAERFGNASGFLDREHPIKFGIKVVDSKMFDLKTPWWQIELVDVSLDEKIKLQESESNKIESQRYNNESRLKKELEEKDKNDNINRARRFLP